MFSSPPIRTGTAGGTLLVLLLKVSFQDLLESGLLAATGAVVSFLVSCLLKRLFRKRSQ